MYEENFLAVSSELDHWCTKVGVHTLDDFLACAREGFVEYRRRNGTFLWKQGIR